MLKTPTIFRAIILTLLLPAVLVADAQIQPLSYALPSPNASSLGEFGEVPVSYYTGLPQIGEQLYTVAGQRLKLAMSLDYHAQGIRPDLHPGWVGSGWNLTIGGAITRIPRHGMDEYNNADFGQEGFYFKHSFIDNANWSSTTTLDAYPFDNPPGSNDYEPDEEPDEFDFNFMGYSGKFFLDASGNWRVQSDKPLKVVFNNSDFVTPFLANYGVLASDKISPAFKKFTIIDEKGNQYIFGGDETAIEYSDNFQSTGELVTATSWFLTKVISADGSETMNLTYQRGPFVANISPYAVSTGYSTSGGSSALFSLNGWACAASSTSSGYTASYVSPVYLSTVSFPNKDILITFNTSKSNDMVYTLAQYQKVGPNGTNLPYGTIVDKSNYMPIPYFQANPMNDGHSEDYLVWLKLSSITIGNIEGNRTYRTIDFSYRENSTSRLSLDDLYIKDGEGNQTEHYHFDYNYAVPLPPYLGCIDDHWGFYNGSGNTDDYNQISNFNTVRTPDVTYAQAEILTKVTYPAGGSSSFYYELNDYSKAVRRDRSGLDSYAGQGGGLRVRQIVTDDGQGNTQTKTYYYVNGYTAGANPATLPSSGILNAEPTYLFNTTGTIITGQPFSYYLLTSTPVIPLTVNSAGLIVGYTNVVELRSDNSYTIYSFTNHDNGYLDVAPVNTVNETDAAYIPTTSLDFERGRPLSVADYDNTGKPVHIKSTSYTVVGNTSTNFCKAVYWSVLNICSGVNAGAQAIVRSAYTLPYYALLPGTESDYTYQGDLNHYVGVQKTYAYDANKLVNTSTYTNSKGYADVTVVTHPADYAGSPYPDMVSRNMLDFEIDKQESVNGVLQEHDINNYNEWSSNVITPQLVQKQVLAQPVQNVTQFYHYDNYGNPLDVSNANDQHISYIWDYSAQYPVAQARNASSTDIAFTSFEADGTGGWSGINNAYVWGNQFAITGNYYYSQPGFSFFKGSLSNTYPYIVSYWSLNGSYSVNGSTGTAGRTLNGWTYYSHTVTPSSGTITVTGSGGIDELRLYPAAAQMSTYTFDRVNGMTSNCDENNRVTYYGYDAYGRINLIRDQDGNVVKKYCYTYNGQSESCSIEGNDNAQSLTLSSTGCGAQYWPGQVTYSIAPNTYWAGSTQAANALAQNELSAHAQNYVNENASCTFLNFYVRIEYTQNYYYSDAYTTEQSTDPVVHFYADAACTIPFAVPDGMTPVVNTVYSGTDQIPSTGYYYSYSNPGQQTLNPGDTEFDEGFMDLYYSTDSGYDIETEDFELQPGRYYTIEPAINHP